MTPRDTSVPSGTSEPTAEKDPKRKTCHRYDVPGDAHFLTFTCFHFRPFLARDRTREWLVEAIKTARQVHEFDLWAYVIMPEHVHLLIHPRPDDHSISKTLVAIKRPVAQKALRYVRRHAPSFLKQMKDAQPNGKVHHRFWQRGGGYDRNIVYGRTVHKTIAYIHANPVRRELVNCPDDWFWSSARFYARRGDVPIVPDTESLPPLDMT